MYAGSRGKKIVSVSKARKVAAGITPCDGKKAAIAHTVYNDAVASAKQTTPGIQDLFLINFLVMGTSVAILSSRADNFVDKGINNTYIIKQLCILIFNQSFGCWYIHSDACI